MLSFEHKKSIFSRYSDLEEKEIINNRLDFNFPKSTQKGKKLATQLHPSGNGYVNGNYMSQEVIKIKGYKLDSRGWINIKDFTEEQLEEVIKDALISMGSKEIIRLNR